MSTIRENLKDSVIVFGMRFKGMDVSVLLWGCLHAIHSSTHTDTHTLAAQHSNWSFALP